MSKKLMKFLLVVGVLVMAFAVFAAFKSADVKAVSAAAAATATPTPAPSPTPVPFAASSQVVAMYPAMGTVDPKTARPSGVTAARGDDAKKTYAVFSPGMNNVPPGVPVYVQAGSTGLVKGATVKTYTWTITGPSGSTAKIANVDKAVNGVTLDMATFTPDKEGEYTVSVVLTDSKGAKSKQADLKVVAQKYAGSETCKGCHKAQYDGWSKTAHGHAFNDFVSMNVESEYYSGGFSCARCHTVGYYPVAGNGGWWDTFVNTLKLNWTKGEFTVTTKGADGKDVQTKYNSISEAIAFNGNPDFSAIDAKGQYVKGPVYGSFDPKLQTVSNIGCESCHGPASVHAAAKDKKATAPMTSADSSSCVQCHDAGGHHTRGAAMQASAHSENASLAEGDRTPCNTCHSAEGAVDIAKGVAPDKARAVNSDIGCATCHDPHSDENPFQLRQVNTVKIPTADIKDAGLSAGCMSCHNNRTNANDTKTGVTAASPSYPHYSSAAEQIAGVGGYDFGAKIANGYHSNIGKGVMTDEAATALNGGVAPGACVLCHMSTTPGGLSDSPTAPAGHNVVGGHSFNMAATINGKVVEQTQVCQQCHPGIKDFNFTADGDFDGNGKADGVQTEVKSLLDMTWKAVVTKAKAEGITITKVDGYPYYTMAPKDAKPSTELKAAIYNFRYVNGIMWGGDGKASAIHNFERSVGLLQVTIEKLSGAPIKNAELLYTLKK